MSEPAPPRPALENLLAPLMFSAAAAFLLIVGGILHRHQQFDLDDPELQVQLAVLAFLWPLFALEAVVRLFQRDGRRGLLRDLGMALLVILIPPVRLGVRSQGPLRELWLPRWGWRVVNRELRKKLERAFSVPMI